MPTARAIINLDTLRANARCLLERASGAGIIAVVKADAYGHGAVPISRALADVGIDFLAVATPDEAIALRGAGISGRILVMTALLPGTLAVYEEFEIDATVGSMAGLNAICEPGAPQINAHLKIDTGMGRVGLLPEQVVGALERLSQASNVNLVGLSTHFASADEDDLADTYRQVDVFTDAMGGQGLDDLLVHLSNTEGLARASVLSTRFKRPMVRLGIGLYGCPIRPDSRASLGLAPVMRLEATVTNVKHVDAGTPISYNGRWRAPRPTTIATVGIGYADGFPRRLRDRASVGVNGRRCPVVGTICMDMIMVDVGAPDSLGDERSVAVGDTVVIFGEGGPDIAEVAGWAETIPYEILTGIGQRVSRLYV